MLSIIQPNGVSRPARSWGAFRLTGMFTGSTVICGASFGTTPLVFRHQPNIMDEVTQLFIKGNLGTKTNISSAGGDILKRVPVTARKHALIYDQSKTDYNRVHVSPGTYSSLWFQLVDWTGLEIDFNGADWSMVVGVG